MGLNVKNPPSILRPNDVQGEIEVWHNEVRNPARGRVLVGLSSPVGADPDDPAVIIHAEQQVAAVAVC